MQPKERLLNAIKGQEIDRVPWSPFLAYWWEAQNKELRDMGQLDFMEKCGADPLLRGFGNTWKMHTTGVEKSEQLRDDYKLEIWKTPVGELRFGSRYSGTGDTWFLVDHPIKTTEDLKTLSWIYEHASVEYDAALEKEYTNIGDRALLLPLVGTEMKTCFQSLVEKYIGTEQLAYLLADEPEEVEACLAAMRSVSDKTAALSAQSPFEAFIFWEDSSTTNISPSMFKKYTAAEVTAWGNTLHAAGKLLIHHACGHLKALLPLMAETPIDAIESISPPPTGNIDIDDAFKRLPQHIALIGGIEPTFFENCTGDELDARVDALLDIGKGRRYVLANSDSCPPGVSIDKFARVTQRNAAYK